MKTSDKFLKLYVPDLDVNGKEFAEAITLTGTKIETFDKLDKNLSKIVVGKIEKIDKHPDADKLVICKVNVGTEVLQIVTGAPNVYEGMLVPAVLVGGKVAASAHDDKDYKNGITIKAGKLRGVESFGMLCSIDELGRPADLYGGDFGIYDLEGLDVKPGDDAIKALGLDDTLYDFEITSNRVDCYSVIGIAREVAATFDKKFVLPNTGFKSSFKDDNYVKLEIKDNDLCKMYASRLVKNIKITDSPEWMKQALRSVGIRPINNIVDITNFVMIEFGQPMHAYDYDKINGKSIIVKKASNGELFTTLDGQQRKLDDTMLTICDSNGIIGLAGIMGGENSMITDDCKNLLLESANFDGINIRLSSKKLGIRTEASNLFEKGLDINNAIMALNRACALIGDLGYGEICENSICAGCTSIPNKMIDISTKKINSLLGTNIDSNIMKNILDKIELTTTIKNINSDDEILSIDVPSIRKDINNYADIAEEVMRFYGYDKADETLPHVSGIPKQDSIYNIVEKNAYDVAIFNGFNEAMNYSFESKKVYDNLNFSLDDEKRNYIKILNPLGEEFEIMRTQLINGMLKSLSTNYNRRNKEARLFEIANIYLPIDKEMTKLPDERKTLLMGIYDKDVDFFYMKGIACEYLDKCRVNKEKVKFVINDKISYMHPGRTASIVYDDDVLGYVGEVHESILKNYEISTKVYVIEFDLKMVAKVSDMIIKYHEICKFPNSLRDLSMIVPKDITVDKIEEVFKKSGGKILKSYELFDIYEGKQVEEGHKSVAYSLTFESMDHSLTDDEVDTHINKIINGLNELGIQLRK